MSQTQEAIILSVPDVSCEHCVHAVDQALSPLPGVEGVMTDLDSKTVRLRYDPSQTSLATIEAALDDAGYTVTK
ncbi:MAG TPA: heavy-metal-associated domain-containing protein [Ktedonobacterales bacterium]|nr:heavy-metal-associated domain-containing protein [Ktedonobacterales bacterium]